MIKLLASMAIIFAASIAWLLVQTAARRFADRHPELGPAREEGGGCGSHCGCQGDSCKRKAH
ncbi:MAG: hypothetical protein OEZ10_04120 [Gammaproteobacteria bacterium]|nr:hypothetical protein [Gammaproteobacteria bacterium]